MWKLLFKSLNIIKTRKFHVMAATRPSHIYSSSQIWQAQCWLVWDPCEHLKQEGFKQKLATAGMEKVCCFQCQAYNSILVCPIFSSCGCFLHLLTEVDSRFFPRQVLFLSFPFPCSHRRFYWVVVRLLRLDLFSLSCGFFAEMLSCMAYS